MNKLKIALDGPSGAGKSSLAKLIAKKYGLVYVDTGALYRTVGLYTKRAGVDPHDKDSVISLLDKIKVELAYVGENQTVFLNGEDVGGFIRTGEISMYASAVSAIPQVRDFLYHTQRDMCDKGGVVMDGRDIGTVIMPDADVKIFVIASPEARAKRRFIELAAKGEQTTYEAVLADIIKRDADDSGREVAPAIAAPDAIVLDNSDITLEETLEAASKIIDKKCGNESGAKSE